jgi:hypothetical protein
MGAYSQMFLNTFLQKLLNKKDTNFLQKMFLDFFFKIFKRILQKECFKTSNILESKATKNAKKK